MRRFGAALLAFFIIVTAFFALPVRAENAASKIDLYCTVNTDGDCLVSMTANLRMDAPDSGLAFPLPYNATEIVVNGKSAATSRVGDKTLVGLDQVVGGLSGEFTIRFDYTLPKAVAVTANRQLQLAIPMLCGFDYPVENLSFIITLPDTVETKPLFTSTYQQIGFESNLDLVVNGNMITGTSINTLNDHETVNMTMAVSTQMFPSVSTYQRTGNPEIVPMAILAGLALLYWLIFLHTLPPHHQRTTVPPEGLSAGELGCRVTLSGGDLSMMVLSWAQMGYLIIQSQGGRVLLHKQMDMGNERSLFEIRVFQALFGKRRVVDCRSKDYARLCAKTAGMVPGEKTMCRSRPGSRKIFRLLLCVSQLFCGICVAMNMTSIAVLQVLFSVIFGLLSMVSAWEVHELAFHIFFRKRARAWTAPILCLFWTLLGLVAGQPWVPLISMLVQLLMGFLAAFGGIRTELNRSEAGEILSIRRFLRRIPRPEAARLIKSDPEYFFRMAPYAIALGVGKPFAAAFGRRKLEQCPYLVTKTQGSRTAEEWMRLMTQTVAQMDDRYRRVRLERWMAIRFR